jgi:hypothetical protein
MNWKSKGEKGERIAIGELAKFDIDVAVPLTDNLPFDFILIYKEKLFKVQVKSAERQGNSTPFDLRTNNWHSKTSKKYSKEEIDIMILCDYNSVFLIGPKDFHKKSSFKIRYANYTQKTSHKVEEYILSEKRIKELLD